jgi:DsbC/DsbD-like thiol-disulfide interchange protein
MTKLFAVTTLLFFNLALFAQVENHVKWGYFAKRTSPGEATIYIKATIDDGWHIYSQHIEEGGPTKTEITFTPSSGYSLVGKTIEPTALTKFDKYFKMTVGWFEKEVVFTQKIKLKSAIATAVKCKLEFGVCNDKNCLPPDEATFNIPVPVK